jgi:signal transduction histidine kinase
MVVSETFNEGAIGMQAFQPNTEWGPFYAFYFAPFLFVYFLVSAWQLVKRYRKEADSAQKAQLLYALLGLGIAVGTGLLFWFVIPFIIPQFAGYFWIGRFSVIFFVGITAFAILNERFFSFRVATAEVFTAIILILLTARAISSIGIWREFMINAGLFVLVAFFSRLLINAVKREADHRRKLEAMMNRLSSANERLEELDAIKSQFLSFASHQVKTPMSVIKGYVSLLEDDMDTLSEEEIEDMSGKIRMATDRTIGLVNNLLDLRKIEEERMEYHMDIVDIVSVAEDVFKDMQVMAKSKDLTFTADLPKEAIFVHADLQKVKQVLQNLVENALKYTKEGKVAISVRKDGDRSVIFSVKDTGVGIAKDALPHLFTEFRKSSAVVKAIKGTGLGLYIAKHIIGAHKGEVWAESAGEGKGSTFLVRLVTVPAVDA